MIKNYVEVTRYLALCNQTYGIKVKDKDSFVACGTV